MLSFFESFKLRCPIRRTTCSSVCIEKGLVDAVEIQVNFSYAGANCHGFCSGLAQDNALVVKISIECISGAVVNPAD